MDLKAPWQRFFLSSLKPDRLDHFLLSDHPCPVVGAYLPSHIWFFCDPTEYSLHARLFCPRILEWLPCPFPDLPDPGIKPASPVLAGRFFNWAIKEAPFMPACPQILGSESHRRLREQFREFIPFKHWICCFLAHSTLVTWNNKIIVKSNHPSEFIPWLVN